jgi:hypothetical protein
LHAFLPKFFPKSFVENIAAKIYRPSAGPHPRRHAFIEEEDFLTV